MPTRIESRTVHIFAEVDNYEDGRDPDHQHSGAYEMTITGRNMAEYLRSLGDHTLWRDLSPDDYVTDMDDRSNRIDVSALVTPD